MAWLGRQVGHVKKAVKTPVAAEPKTVYRKEVVQEAKVEGTNHVLRRTTVDEVIVDPKKRMGETTMPRKEDHGV